jgi:hypothetical protein
MNTQPVPNPETPSPLDQFAAIVAAEGGRVRAETALQTGVVPELFAPTVATDGLRTYFGRLTDLSELAGHPDVPRDEQDRLAEEFRVLLAPLKEVVDTFAAENPPGPRPSVHERIAATDNMHPVARRQLEELR